MQDRLNLYLITFSLCNIILSLPSGGDFCLFLCGMSLFDYILFIYNAKRHYHKAAWKSICTNNKNYLKKKKRTFILCTIQIYNMSECIKRNV